MGGAASVETGRRPTVVALDGVDEALMGLVGGKAAGLVRLLRLGLPVPPGIVVTATAFGDLFHDAHARAAALMPQTPDGDACAPLGAGPLVEAEPSLQALVESALDATGLSSEVFAVRSSATDEDAHGSSFAGIHETFLGVPRSCLARAAIRCWASAFAPRAQAYREARRRGAVEAPVAVLIQPLVPAVSAGVAFTLDAATGARDDLVINSTWGLGESVASGVVEPDILRVAKHAPDFPTREIRIGSKLQRTAASEDGLRREETPPHLCDRPSLPERARRELAALAVRVEEALGGPQDIEWAWDGERVWLLQARPITAAAPARADTLWSRANYREIFPEMPSPLAASELEVHEPEWASAYFARHGVDVAGRGPYLRLIHGRPYVNLSLLSSVAEQSGADPDEALRAMGHDGDVGNGTVEWQRVLRNLPRVARWTLSHVRAEAQAARFFARVRRALRGLGNQTQQTTFPEAFLSAMDLSDDVQRHFLETAFTLSGALSAQAAILDALVRPHVRDPRHFLDALIAAGRDDLSTREMLDLLALGHLARSDPQARGFLESGAWDRWEARLAGTRFAARLRRFLGRYGHRAPRETDPAVPRYREDPTPLFAALRGYLQAPDLELPEQIRARRREAGRRAWEEFERGLGPLHRLLPAKRLLVRWATRRTQRLLGLRERVRFEGVRVTAGMRARYLALGSQWHRSGALERPEDIFWLREDEIRCALLAGAAGGPGAPGGGPAGAWGPAAPGQLPAGAREPGAPGQLPDPSDQSDPTDPSDRPGRQPMRPEEPAPPSLADVVARRKAEYARLAGLDLPNTLWESVLPRLVGQHAAAAPGRPDLRGIPLSSGHAEGRAAVLHSPNDLDRMHPGDVLVAPVIGPGWTALFPLAAGIVVEMGGTLSHGAIVAREYGLPGVINVHGAMQALHDGDRIRVDADAGRVEVLSCEHDP